VRFSLFGSVLRDDFRPESDIDILVEFATNVRYGVSKIVTMGDELEALFGRSVDILDRMAILQSPPF
jgi:predicted nucleotidyltransferase